MVVDYDGRILAQADPGPGEKIVVASIDVAALRAERERRTGHHMLAHLRTEAYTQARRPIYPAGLAGHAPFNTPGTGGAPQNHKDRFAWANQNPGVGTSSPHL